MRTCVLIHCPISLRCHYLLRLEPIDDGGLAAVIKTDAQNPYFALPGRYLPEEPLEQAHPLGRQPEKALAATIQAKLSRYDDSGALLIKWDVILPLWALQ